MGLILMLHSIVRWAIVGVALVALFRFGLGWLCQSQLSKMDRSLAPVFSGLMDLQAALGLIYLLWSAFSGDGLPVYRITHTGFMVAAVAAGHLPRKWKDAPDRIRYRNTFACIGGSLLLIAIGVFILPQGWTG